MKSGLALSLSNGFTLIELMVGMAIFGVIIIVATGMLIQIIQESNRVTTNNELRQNGERIMADIGAEIKKAGSFKFTPPEDNLNPAVYKLFTYADKNCTDPATATFVSSIDVSTPFSSLNNFYFNKAIGTVSSPIISTRAVVANCGATSTSCSNNNGTSPCSQGFTVSPVDICTTSSAQITLTIQQSPGPTRSDFCGNVILTDTFVPRN